MNMRFLPAAWNGGRAFSLLAVLCCFVLTACATGGAGKKAATDEIPDLGKTRRLAYGISIQAPDDWQTIRSLEPGAASKADLEARIKTSQAVPILILAHPSGQTIDARLTLLLTDSSKNFPPEQEVATRSAEELDERAKTFMRQRNAAAVKQNKQPDTLESRMTRESVDGRLALFHRGIGSGPDGQVHFQVWNIYLPNGVGLAVDAMGSADRPGMEKTLESLVRTLKIE
ncbi:MAG: hypothetical protein LBP61_08695 [Desulfovibrio sp.]|jgi:hypothetical protein|nr:hypothetical protein [Desulfovibrio sp.]